MHYEMSRGLKSGRQLTTAQRTSGTFAEEPVVLGKVLRRGMRPIHINEEQFNQSKSQLLRLLLSGSIEIHVINGGSTSRLDYRTAMGISTPAVPAVEVAEVTEASAVIPEVVPEIMTAKEEEVEPPVSEPIVEDEVADEDEEPILPTRSQA